MGVVAGVITARLLGPDGKGLFSSVTFLAGLVMQVASIGLGDASIVLIGQGKATVQKAVSATLAAGLCASALAIALYWVVALLAFRKDWADVRSAAIIAALGIPVLLLTYLLGFLLTAQERIVATSVVNGVVSTVTTLGVAFFVALVPLSVAGGTLGTVVGPAAGLVLAAVLLSRRDLSLIPRWDGTYLRAAVRYGLPVETSYVLTIMFLRVDLLFMYLLAGAGPAGHYSVALTVASMVGLLPIAISYASFPRLAYLDQQSAMLLTAQTCRVALSATVSAAAVVLLVVPVVIPLLFGSDFRPAIVPTMILVPGSVATSITWLLCRAEAARGRPALLVAAFALGLIVMCAGDLALIPWLGINGAACAAVVGPAASLALCARWYQRSSRWTLPLSQLLPRAHDFRQLWAQSREMLSRRPRREPDAGRSRHD